MVNQIPSLDVRHCGSIRYTCVTSRRGARPTGSNHSRTDSFFGLNFPQKVRIFASAMGRSKQEHDLEKGIASARSNHHRPAKACTCCSDSTRCLTLSARHLWALETGVERPPCPAAKMTKFPQRNTRMWVRSLAAPSRACPTGYQSTRTALSVRRKSSTRSSYSTGGKEPVFAATVH
jgi:hypothetical protein